MTRAKAKKRACVVVSSEATIKAFLRTQLEAMQDEYDVTVVVNTEREDLLRELGLDARLVRIAIERDISLLDDLKALVRLVQLFRRERFRIVHSVTPKAGLLAMTAGVLSRVPTRIHTFTGQVWATRAGASRMLLKNIDRILAAAATYILVDSPSQRDFLLDERVVSPAKSAVLGRGSVSGVDTERFRPDAGARKRVRESLRIPQDAQVLLFVGRLNRDKGLLDLANAFNRVAEREARAHLVVVGPDEQNMAPEMRRICSAHEERLRFVDFTSTPEAMMAAADVLCLPSYREGFGSVIIEAAAVGLPAVASRIYGIVDAVEDGVTGLLHPPRDVEAIVETLLRITGDAALRERLANAARERAHREFSQPVLTAALLATYERLLDGAKAVAAEELAEERRPPDQTRSA